MITRIELSAHIHQPEEETVNLARILTITSAGLESTGLPTTTKYLATISTPLISVEQSHECVLSKVTMAAEDESTGVTLGSNLIECSCGQLKMSGCSLISVSSRESGGFEMNAQSSSNVMTSDGSCS